MWPVPLVTAGLVGDLPGHGILTTWNPAQNLQRALSQKERGCLKPCQYQNLPCCCSCCCHRLHLGTWHLCLCDLKGRQPELVLGQVGCSLGQVWESSLPCVLRLTQWCSHCSCIGELFSAVAALLGWTLCYTRTDNVMTWSSVLFTLVWGHLETTDVGLEQWHFFVDNMYWTLKIQTRVLNKIDHIWVELNLENLSSIYLICFLF